MDVDVPAANVKPVGVECREVVDVVAWVVVAPSHHIHTCIESLSRAPSRCGDFSVEARFSFSIENLFEAI